MHGPEHTLPRPGQCTSSQNKVNGLNAETSIDVGAEDPLCSPALFHCKRPANLMSWDDFSVVCEVSGKVSCIWALCCLPTAVIDALWFVWSSVPSAVVTTDIDFGDITWSTDSVLSHAWHWVHFCFVTRQLCTFFRRLKNAKTSSQISTTLSSNESKTTCQIWKGRSHKALVLEFLLTGTLECSFSSCRDKVLLVCSVSGPPAFSLKHQLTKRPSSRALGSLAEFVFWTTHNGRPWVTLWTERTGFALMFEHRLLSADITGCAAHHKILRSLYSWREGKMTLDVEMRLKFIRNLSELHSLKSLSVFWVLSSNEEPRQQFSRNVGIYPVWRLLLLCQSFLAYRLVGRWRTLEVTFESH